MICLRPTGRSGWVKTAMISWPASISLRNEGTANSGVPIKISFIALLALPKQRRARKQAVDLRKQPLADARGTAPISAGSLGVGDKPSQSSKKSGRKIEPCDSPFRPLIGECCSAYSSSATLKLICGIRNCPLTSRSFWSFSTPAASALNSDSRNSLYLPFENSSR